jgi:hypothetical protein
MLTRISPNWRSAMGAGVAPKIGTPDLVNFFAIDT